MADTPGDGNVDICLVSPSDQAGQINNLLDRVHNLEVAVATLAGLDVTATNASDLVESLGTITNGTIILPDNSVTGWTNSIPPGDFTGTIISNGVITTWNNGVVSFEVTPSGGIVTGGGGTPKRLVRSNMDFLTLSNAGALADLKLSGPEVYNDTIGATFGATSFTLPRTGYYFVSVYVWFSDLDTKEDGAAQATFVTDNGTIGLTWNMDWGHSSGTGSMSIKEACHFSGIVDIAAGDTCYVSANQTSGGTCDTNIMNLSIIEL